MLPFDVWPSNNVNAPLCRFWQDNPTHDWTFSLDCIFYPIHLPRFLIAVACLTRPRTKQQFVGLFAICNPWRRLELIIRQKYMNKIHHLLRILAIIGRYGSHLMIVMIFVTQNNFLAISDRLLGFYQAAYLIFGLILKPVMSPCLSVTLSFSACLSVRLSALYLSFCLSVSAWMFVSVSQLVCLWLPVCLTAAYLSACASVCPSTCLSL